MRSGSRKAAFTRANSARPPCAGRPYCEPGVTSPTQPIVIVRAGRVAGWARAAPAGAGAAGSPPGAGARRIAIAASAGDTIAATASSGRTGGSGSRTIAPYGVRAAGAGLLPTMDHTGAMVTIRRALIGSAVLVAVLSGGGAAAAPPADTPAPAARPPVPLFARA